MATKKASAHRTSGAAPARSGARTGARGTSSTRRTTTTTRRTAAKTAPSSSALSRTTTDHDQIRNWAEQRGAHPACVKGTGGKGDVGMLRLDFPGYSEEKLEPISWDDFFQKFDEQGLALVYQEKTAGGAVSNFNKLVSRETTGEGRKKAAR